MSDSPEIPDSISARELSAFLTGGQRLPLSAVIPSLNFSGRGSGGACDLQFTINQLICASSGANIVQVLCAAIHLLTELDWTLGEQGQAAELAHSPFDTASDEERSAMVRFVASHRRALQSALLHLESVMALTMPVFASERLAQLREAGVRRMSAKAIRSFLLISDELLADLELDRDAINDYLHLHPTL